MSKRWGLPAQSAGYGRCKPFGSLMARLVFGLAMVSWPGFLSALPAATDEATDVMRRMQVLLRADTNEARYTMRVITPEWQREIRLQSWDDRPCRRFFIRILAPRKDRDTTFLKVGPNLWMYIPRLERDIRIPPSMMLSAWMGSDFTNDDLVKSASIVDDYTHRILSRDDEAFVIESLPRPEAPVVWGKLVHRIRRDGIPLWAEYYDEHGQLLRRLRFEAVREVGGRRIPTRWIMQPLTRPGHETVLILEDASFNIPLDARIFERAHLRRRD